MKESGFFPPEQRSNNRDRRPMAVDNEPRQESHGHGNQKVQRKGKGGKTKSCTSNSETTIYDNAIQPEVLNPDSQMERVSTSSEEINTSDELIYPIGELQIIPDAADVQVPERRDHQVDKFYDRPPQPGGSGGDARQLTR